MLFLNCIPAAEIFDRCQLHLQVKSICMLFQDRLINRPIVILRDQLLRFIGIQIFQISFCGICVIVFFYIFIYNSNGRLCQDTDARCYDLVIIRIVPYRKKRFISQAISTSPCPFSTKEVVAPLAPESRTRTFL